MKSSQPRRIAVVTEGPSDFLVLRTVLHGAFPEAEVVPVHPPVPLAAYAEFAQAAASGIRRTGWRGVWAWCSEYGQTLELFLRADVGNQYDALVVHVDASMADKVGAEHSCPPARATTDALRGVIAHDWLARNPLPPFVVLATPSKMTDAWVVSALDLAGPNLECDKSVEQVLVRKRKLRKKDGEVKKPRRSYEPLAERVASKWDYVRSICSEADRFHDELLALVPLAGESGTGVATP